MSTEITKLALVAQKADLLTNRDMAMVSATDTFLATNHNHLKPELELFFLKNIIDSNDKLADCTAEEAVKIYLSASRLGLTFQDTYGFLYVIPYWNNGRNKPQLQIGYKGMEYLMKKSGLIKRVIGKDLVYQGEEYESGIKDGQQYVVHKKSPFTRDKSKPEIGGYIFIEKFNGETMLLELSTADFNYARGKSKSWPDTVEKQKTSVWHQQRDAMCLKTIWRRLYSELLAEIKIASEEKESAKYNAVAEAYKMSQQELSYEEDAAINTEPSIYEEVTAKEVQEQEPETKVEPKVETPITTTTTTQKPAKTTTTTTTEQPNVVPATDPQPNTDEDAEKAKKKECLERYKSFGIGLSVIKAMFEMNKNDLFTIEQMDILYKGLEEYPAGPPDYLSAWLNLEAKKLLNKEQ